MRIVRDFAQVHNVPDIESTLVNTALNVEGVDEVGLDDQDRQYLKALTGYFQGGTAGLSALAKATQMDADTLEDVVEPYLLHEGFISRTPRGRQATQKAFTHLGLRPLSPPAVQPPSPANAEESAPAKSTHLREPRPQGDTDGNARPTPLGQTDPVISSRRADENPALAELDALPGLATV